MKYFTCLLLYSIFFTSTIGYPQNKNGFEITVNANNLEGKKLVLYFNYGTNKKKINVDTLEIKSNVFKGKIDHKKGTKGVIYSLAFIENPSGAILLAIDNNSSMELQINYPIMDSIKCISSDLNKKFLSYQLDKKLSYDQKIALFANVDKLYSKSVLNLYFSIEKSIIQKYPPDIKDPVIYRNLYLRDVNLTDKRLPFLPNIYKFLNKMVTSLPIKDTIYCENIDSFLKDLDCKNTNYKTIIEWLVSNLAFNEALQLENAFKHLFEKYINIKECDVFSDANLNRYRNNYQAIIKLPNGSQVPDFTLFDKEDKAYSLSEIYPANDYTLVVFFSPSCSHCQKDIPKNKLTLDQIAKNHASKSIQIVSVLNDEDQSLWEEFIQNSKTENWLNLKNKEGIGTFQETFNSYSNPNYFLINKKGQILLKNFNPKAIDDLIAANK